MPNTVPAIDSVETLKYVDEQGKRAGLVNLLSVCAMTKGLQGKELCDFKALNDVDTKSKELTGHGICAISEDGKTLKDANLMAEVCLSAKALDLPIMDHAEPEVDMVYRDIELAKKYGCRIHIQHVSKVESLKLIREAKKDNIPITAEAAPHHFALNENAIAIHGSNAKMNPPLATEEDRLAVIEGLLDDTIDIIATDHAPHAATEKKVPYIQAPNGIVGLETAFPISYTLLVKSGLMSFEKLIHKMSIRPREIIGMKPVSTEIEEDSDYCVVDLDKAYEIDKQEFLSKGVNTPFHGMKVYGKVMATERK
jgi:dihydroorotase